MVCGRRVHVHDIYMLSRPICRAAALVMLHGNESANPRARTATAWAPQPPRSAHAATNARPDARRQQIPPSAGGSAAAAGRGGSSAAAAVDGAVAASLHAVDRFLTPEALNAPWLLRSHDHADAVHVLKDEDEGCFVVRFSTKALGHFVLAYKYVHRNPNLSQCTSPTTTACRHDHVHVHFDHYHHSPWNTHRHAHTHTHRHARTH